MTPQVKMNLQKTFIKINQENNIKNGNNSKSKYFNSIFTQDDSNDFSESTQDSILLFNFYISFLCSAIYYIVLMLTVAKKRVRAPVAHKISYSY